MVNDEQLACLITLRNLFKMFDITIDSEDDGLILNINGISVMWEDDNINEEKLTELIEDMM